MHLSKNMPHRERMGRRVAVLENPMITQPKPSNNQEKESEKDTETEFSAGKPPSTPSDLKLKRKQYGQYGWVKLSDQEYSRLSNDLGETELKRCIAYVDESAQSNGNRNKWRDWNLVLRKCNRQGWGLNTPQERAFAYTPRPECVPDED